MKTGSFFACVIDCSGDRVAFPAELHSLNYCTDALDDQVEYNRYFGVSGVLFLRMDMPESEWAPGILDVRMSNIELTTDYGHTVTLPSLEVEDIHVIQHWGG